MSLREEIVAVLFIILEPLSIQAADKLIQSNKPSSPSPSESLFWWIAVGVTLPRKG